MIYTYLRDGDPEIDAMLMSVCEIGGGAVHKLTDLSLRLTGYPETALRAAASLTTAKKPPRTRAVAFLKASLYSAQYNRFRAYFEGCPHGVAVAWNGIKGTRLAFMAAAKDAGRPTVYLERAPLPGRVTVDPQGVNQQNSLPRDPDFFRGWAAGAPERAGDGWKAMKARLTARASKRADVAQGRENALGDGPFVFCPLQVPDDTQIRQFSGWVGPIESFLDILSDAVASLPDGWHLRLKEHPSSKISLKEHLDAMRARHGDRVVVDNRTDTFLQVERARAVVTLNSSVGLQSFFFDRPVILLGEAFFRLPGLVNPADSREHVSEIFAGIAAIDYDAPLRDAFMNYLDQVYYPHVVEGPDGLPRVTPELVLPKLPSRQP